MERLRQPAEWSAQDAIWAAWPAAADLWEDQLAPAQAAWTAMCRAVGTPMAGQRAQPLRVIAADAASVVAARSALAGLDATVHEVPYGDIWLRDIAPIFMRRAGRVVPVCFRFNGWGGKYVLEHDDEVAERIAALDGRPAERSLLVLEGGSVDVDGEGTALTTRQCLLNPNRNPDWSAFAIEAEVQRLFGVDRVLWLDEGLLNDHTDGHIDNIARFVAPGVVLCQSPAGPDDPNAEVLDAIARQLDGMVDAAGRKVEVVRVPSPGLVLDDEGEIMAASHANFLISNHAVVVPTYGTPSAEAAVAAIGALFPGRRTVGVDAKAILSGGGSFHCITQQVPVEEER